MKTTNWIPFLREKAKKVVLNMALGMQDIGGCPPDSPFRDALYNACKIYVHTIEMETLKDLDDAHYELSSKIFDSPITAEQLIADFEYQHAKR